MPRVMEKTVYQFDELSDDAKETARAWFRDGSADDSFWSESVIDDAVTIGNILGIEFDRAHGRNSPAIYWSGFWSQGDGACFEGSYSYAKGAAKKIRKHAPQDEKLHTIAEELQTIQKQAGYGLQASMNHRGHYYHSGCMAVDVSHSKDWNVESWNDSLTRIMRDFADWMYRALESEYEYQNADAQVDESIRANEYEFTESGSRTVVIR